MKHALSPKAKRILQRVRDKILAVPESYNQHHYGIPADTPCGTVACLAGHILIEGNFCTVEELIKRRKNGRRFDVGAAAEEVLGGVRTYGLFGTGGCWPYKYGKALYNARTKRGQARVAARLIDALLAAGSTQPLDAD